MLVPRRCKVDTSLEKEVEKDALMSQSIWTGGKRLSEVRQLEDITVSKRNQR